MRYEDLENNHGLEIKTVNYQYGVHSSKGWVVCKGYNITLEELWYDTFDQAVEGIKKRIVDTAMAFEGNYLLRRGEQNTEV